MGQLDRDKQRDHDRRLAELQTAAAYRQVRAAAAVSPIFERGPADGLIHAAGGGHVDHVGSDLTNVTGHPVWNNANCVCWMDFAQPLILLSDASTVIAGEYVSGTKTLVASYTSFQAANGGHFDDTGLNDTNFTITDPSGILPGITGGDLVLFETGIGTSTPNLLTVIELVASGTASGGGALPWPDFPTTPDPTTGTTTMIAFRAVVDETAGVASTDGTFSFKGGTSQIGTHDETGEAVNKRPAAFVHEEPIEVLKSPGGTCYALKIGGNRIIAQCDGTPAMGLFNLKSVTALEGPAPHADQIVAEELEDQEWADNDWGLFWLDDTKRWNGVKLLADPPSGENELYVLSEVCTAATFDGSELTPGFGNGEKLVYDDPSSPPTWTVDDEVTAVLYNSTPSTIPSGSVVQIKRIDGFRFIDVVNCSPFS